MNSAPVPRLIVTIPERIVQVSLGAEFSLVLDANGEVWGWGSNSDGQVGAGHFSQVSEPVMVLRGKGIKQIKAGKNHSVAWTSSSRADFGGGPIIGTPDVVPAKYDILQNEKIDDCRLRLRHLHKFNEDLFRCWKFLNVTNKAVSDFWKPFLKVYLQLNVKCIFFQFENGRHSYYCFIILFLRM